MIFLKRSNQNPSIIIFYLLCAILLTWPTAANFTSELAGGRRDLFVHQWTFWWVKEALLSGRNPFFTVLLYYPHGVSLATHGIAWVHIAAWLPLQTIFGELVAYNIVYLMGFLAAALAMYYFALELLQAKWPALLAGLVFAFWPYTLSHFDHPNLILHFGLPLALLFLTRLFRRPRLRYAVLTAVNIAAIGFNSWHILLMSAPLLIFYTIYLWGKHRDSRTKRTAGLVGLAAVGAAVLLTPIALPVLAELSSTSATIFEPDGGRTDLLSYFVTPAQYGRVWGETLSAAPIIWPYERIAASTYYIPYIGLTTLVLAFIGAYAQMRERWFWLAVALFYATAAVGPVLAINGQILLDWMPYQLVADTFLGTIIRRPHRINFMLALPLALLAGCGLLALQGWIETRIKSSSSARLSAVLTLALIALILVETKRAVPFTTTPLKVPAWYEILAQEAGEFGILPLPIGDRLHDKVYMLYQTHHGRPIATGHVSRLPLNAFRLLDEVPFLQTFFPGDAPVDFSLTAVSQQLRPLAEANVRYLVIHKSFASEGQLTSWRDWLTAEPAYEDDEVIVYHTDFQAGRDFVLQHALTDEIGLIRTSYAPVSTLHGGVVKVDVRWGSTVAPSDDYHVCITLQDESGFEGFYHCQPIDLNFPTSDWRAGEVVRGSYDFWIEETLPAKNYALGLKLISADTGANASETVLLGQLAIEPFEPEFTTSAVWGKKIELAGYDMEAAAETLNLTLYWRGLEALETDYKVFVHLIDPTTAEIIAQHDGVPRGWTYPTTAWEAGEIVADEIQIPLEGVAEDSEIWVGLYDSNSGIRLELEPSDFDLRNPNTFVLDN